MNLWRRYSYEKRSDVVTTEWLVHEASWRSHEVNVNGAESSCGPSRRMAERVAHSSHGSVGGVPEGAEWPMTAPVRASSRGRSPSGWPSLTDTQPARAICGPMAPGPDRSTVVSVSWTSVGV
jgi:hypothetical protein